MASMSLKEAVSATDFERDPYCLLHGDERRTYRCAETAANLGAMAEETRKRAFWHHYWTHLEPYARWAAKKNLFDPTIRYPDPREAAGQLVAQVLFSFLQKVQEGQYDAGRGPPCRYVKQAIRNRFQDIKRRGHRPTREECARCQEERGNCPAFRMDHPGEQERRRCRRLPSVESLDDESVVFAIAGLQEEWPSAIRAGPDARRPVEDQALQDVLSDAAWTLLEEELTPNQRTVLTEIVLNHKTGREIALKLHTTLDNVYKIKSRGRKRLKKLLGL